MIPKVGETFTGTVVQVAPFGVFVEHPGGSHGLLHGQTADEGSTVQVQVLDVDEQRQRFSLELVVADTWSHYPPRTTTKDGHFSHILGAPGG